MPTCVNLVLCLDERSSSSFMIHPTAIVSSDAQIDASVEVGPYAIIQGPVKIGAGSKVLAHAQILGDTQIGERCSIGRGAIIGEDPQDLGFDPKTPSGVRIGNHNTLREHVTIHRGSKANAYTSMGDYNFLMASSHLAHDVVLGHHNILANAVLIAGHVQVGNFTFMGGGAVFHQFLRIGDYCVIQGNGSFSKDIPHFCAAQRINRVTGLNVIGLRRQGFDASQRQQIKDAFRFMYRSGLNLSQALEAARAREWSDPAQKFLKFFEGPSKKGICPLDFQSSDNS